MTKRNENKFRNLITIAKQNNVPEKMLECVEKLTEAFILSLNKTANNNILEAIVLTIDDFPIQSETKAQMINIIGEVES